MSYKFLFVSKDALISDIAWQTVKEGHEVKYFIENKSEDDIANGFVPKTKDWRQDIDWSEVIIFDDVLGQGTIADELRKSGKKVIGGTPYTDRLEDDRSFGQSELKKHGVKIIPYWDFDNFDKAIIFVKEHPDEYVIKPSGEVQNIKRLLFVGMEKDGSDVIRVLNSYKKVWSDDIKIFQLQKKVKGVEIAVGAFFNGKKFIYPININFEHKKLFPGDLGPATGEMGCYDSKTEVLTKKGWKLFRNIDENDEFLTVNNKNVIEYQKATDIVCLGDHKEILLIQNQTVDIAVTLNHNMYGIEANKYRNGERTFGFVEAKNLPHQFVIPRTAKWLGRRKETFILPSILKYHKEGKGIVKKTSEEIRINMDDWLRFLGFYIAEGSYSKGYKVSLACMKNIVEVKQILSKLPFKFRKNKSEFYTYSKQLHNYLARIGKANEKYVPEFVKSLNKKQIEIFLDWYGKGDGNMNNNFRIFYTSSKRLANDIQELLLKIGRVGIIKVRNRQGRVWIKDHWAKINHPQYEILERIKKTVSWLDKRDMEIIEYRDKVYCVTVPNHTLYIRRNGKPCFCGNTSMFWSEPNRLFDETLKKLENTLVQENYAGYIDINCIVNGQGIYPLEFTARFGYPTISIQKDGIINPISEVLYSLANGKDYQLKVKKGFQVGVRIIVPPYPFRDKKTFNSYSRGATIVFKKLNSLEGIHIEDVKIVNGEWVVTGSAGVALIVVGTGLTMKEAQRQAYSRIDNILIPNMYYRKDIGDRWFEEGDKLYSWNIV